MEKELNIRRQKTHIHTIWGSVNPIYIDRQTQNIWGNSSRGGASHWRGEVAGYGAQGGDPYADKSEVGSDLRGDTVVLGLWATRKMCVLCIHIFDTDVESYYGRQPHKILSQH